MQLTATLIELPNSEWEIRNFKEMKSLSEETMCFTATLTHLPTKAKYTLENSGHGGETFMRHYDVDRSKYVVADAAWKDFLEACRPVLVETVADEPMYVEMYNEMDVHGLEDSVLGLFSEEAAVRKMLSRAATNACVRQDSDRAGSFDVYNASPEFLIKQGKVHGQYWDKTRQEWVAF